MDDLKNIDDWYAYFCAMNKHGNLAFVEFLQENNALGFSPTIWQVFHNAFVEYCTVTFDFCTFYQWLKSTDYIDE